jgi:hypothetical protein
MTRITKRSNKILALLVNVYPGTGRPNRFVLVDEANQDRIDQLVESFNFSICQEGCPGEYCEQDAWRDMTRIDSDGFIQWA